MNRRLSILPPYIRFATLAAAALLAIKTSCDFAVGKGRSFPKESFSVRKVTGLSNRVLPAGNGPLPGFILSLAEGFFCVSGADRILEGAV